jgi:hypothetical protein
MQRPSSSRPTSAERGRPSPCGSAAPVRPAERCSGEARRRRRRERAPPHVVSMRPSGGRSLRFGAAQIGPEAKGGADTLWSFAASCGAGSPRSERQAPNRRAPATRARRAAWQAAARARPASPPRPSSGTFEGNPRHLVSPARAERTATEASPALAGAGLR